MRDLDFVSFFDDECLPLYERVLDRLGEILLDTDEILGMLRNADAQSLAWMRPSIHRLFDDVDGVMNRLCD